MPRSRDRSQYYDSHDDAKRVSELAVLPGASSSLPAGSSTEQCKTCSDFKSWMEKRRSSPSATLPAVQLTEEKAVYVERDIIGCPQDKDELGNATWKFLHTVSVNYPEKPSTQEQTSMSQFLNLFAQFYPCTPCAKDLQENLKKHPPRLQSATEFAQWMCEEHNRVNEKLGKEQFDCRKVFERWRDGWKNGSCN